MAKQLQPGDAAPGFEARSTRGVDIRIEDYRGRYLVLYFFPKAFTPGCTREAHRFRDNYPEIRQLGAEVLGVSSDSHSTQCDFAEQHRVTFPLINDTELEISQAYGVARRWLPLSKRVTFVIDPEGRIAARFQHEFQVNRHLDDVLRYLKSVTPPRTD